LQAFANRVSWGKPVRSTIAPVYNKHFGLKQAPFSIAPDPRYLFMSERHREALAHLLYGLHGTGGVVLLTGEIGAGKTTVCRCFLEQVPEKCNVAYIFNPKLTVPELLRTVCDEFGIPRGHIANAQGTVKDYVDAINEFLLRTHAVGQNNVLIIDEAQNLSVDVLEQLRLLTNLETTERKLLQIILIGQPELRDMLAQPALEQLAQRVTARYHLEALNEDETTQYMRHRLAIGGRTGGMPFDTDARRRIHALSRGVPRRINLLCDRAMLGAYAAGRQRITGAMMDQASVEVFGPDSVGMSQRELWLRRGPWIAGGVMLGALLVSMAMWAQQVRPSYPTPMPDVSRAAPAPVAAPAGVSNANAATSVAPVKPTAAVALAMSSAEKPSTLAVTTALPTAATVATTTAAAASSTPAAATAPSTAVAIKSSIMAASIKPLSDEQQGWHLLALTSKVTLDVGGDACVSATKQRLSCARRNDADLRLLKATTSPALLTLRDELGKASYVVYTGVSDEASVTLRGEGGDAVKLDMLWFATQWRGELAVFKPMAVAINAASK
jgi:general secretion pathway protein A